jgi:hypothetical protein
VEQPQLQARTSALISKVEEEILPRLKGQQEGVTQKNEPAVIGREEEGQYEKEDSAAAAPTTADALMMQDLKLCEESTYTSGVARELYTAKECLDRAEIMLLVSFLFCFFEQKFYFSSEFFLLNSYSSFSPNRYRENPNPRL